MTSPTTGPDSRIRTPRGGDPDWWRSAVIYQVYIRSFADSDGDGLGDIAGLRSRLPYLAELGVDAVWINPWYPSPMADAGYDVADYRAIEPRFGTLDDADLFVKEAHELGIRVLLDIVPNHTSDQHAWFQAALAAGPGSAERQRYLFRPGGGEDGSQPPNDWHSVFGGPAWERVTEPDGTPGEWYLHLFAPQQPDLNWDHPDVHAEFLQTLRFWFDRGVDGFRIDVAHSLVKDYDLPDVGGLTWPRELPPAGHPEQAHPFWDRDTVHDIYREWRALADSYQPRRVFVAEAWVDRPERLVMYIRTDELHTAFNFDFLKAPWLAEPMRRTIDKTMREHRTVGAPATWVLSNHDVARHVSRYARPQSGQTHQLRELLDQPADLELGLRRARAATLLMFALPGGAYVYQGEELGLPEVEDLPEDALQDPTWERSGHTDRGRDGCRVPLPWSGEQAPYGFGPAGSTPWLPQPPIFAEHTAERLDADPDSVLNLYRRALHLRRDLTALGDGSLTWLDSEPDVLAFRREPGFTCVVNFGSAPVPLPPGRVLVTSSPLDAGGLLPTDAAAWLAD